MIALGLGDLWDAFEFRGWNTVGNFAFAAAANFAGGPQDQEVVKRDILIPLFGETPDHRIPPVRRLHFECYTEAVGDLQRRSTKTTDEDKPRIMPPAERDARLTALKLSLSGVEIEGDLEPSDTLVDKYSHMHEASGVLRYLPWTEVGRRDMEVKGVKKDSFWKPDASGNLKLHEVGFDSPADLGTDYKMARMLMRRGVALELARLMSFRTHELLTRWFMKEYHREPPRGHSKVTVDQIMDADQEIFLRMAEETRGGLHADPHNGQLALDGILPVILLEPRILALLNPRPSGGRSSFDPPAKRGADPEIERLREDNKRLRTQAKQANRNTQPDKPGKANGKRSKASMPSELRGYEPTIDGKRVCFGFNMKKGCTDKTSDNTCSRGAHLCLQCGTSKHGACDCSSKKHFVDKSTKYGF